MDGNFTEGLQEVIKHSKDEAMRLGSETINIGHLLLGVLKRNDGVGIDVLQSLDVNLGKLKTSLEKELGKSKIVITTNIPLSKNSEKVLKVTYLESKLYKSEKIGSEHLILSILRDEENEGTKCLRQQNINYDTFRKELDSFISGVDSKDIEINISSKSTGKSSPHSSNFSVSHSDCN